MKTLGEDYFISNCEDKDKCGYTAIVIDDPNPYAKVGARYRSKRKEHKALVKLWREFFGVVRPWQRKIKE